MNGKSKLVVADSYPTIDELFDVEPLLFCHLADPRSTVPVECDELRAYGPCGDKENYYLVWGSVEPGGKRWVTVPLAPKDVDADQMGEALKTLRRAIKSLVYCRRRDLGDKETMGI